MSNLYFNPDDVFLTQDGGREYPLSELDGAIYGGGDTYSHISANTYDYIDDVGGNSNIWGGKDEMTDDISSAILKSNKRFAEKKWLKPTKHSALDEIINILNDTTTEKDNTIKSEKDGNLELVQHRSSAPKVLNPDDSHSDEDNSDSESLPSLELSRTSNFEGLDVVRHMSLSDFKNSRSINSKLELRKK